jgi:uncharacterized protein YbjT (DUF2867 family)
MNERTKIAVAGATGRLGRHIVEVVEERGYEAVPMSRTNGVDVVTGDGLAEALAGVETGRPAPGARGSRSRARSTAAGHGATPGTTRSARARTSSHVSEADVGE